MASLTISPPRLDLARAQQLDRTSLKLGVANKAHLYYLPVTIAERRGHFRDYGLSVTMSDFEGGGQAFDALLAGSVDVAAGAYEHTLRAQAMGKDVRAVIELGRFPGVVLAVAKDRPFKSMADLKGLKIGVTAPDSSSHFFVLYLMARSGLAPGDSTFVGVGGGERAVEAMKTGQIDAISNLDPVITRLQQDGAIRIVVDSRFPRVNYEIFGGTNPAAVLYLKKEFADANPVTTQRLTNALYAALEWLAKATPAEVADTVPPEYLLGDRPLYEAAVKASLPSYSRTGVVTKEGMDSVYATLKQLDPEFKDVNVDLSKTFIDTFVKQVK
jgi:NitT/TauT family transport system substrate-binding protein